MSYSQKLTKKTKSRPKSSNNKKKNSRSFTKKLKLRARKLISTLVRKRSTKRKRPTKKRQKAKRKRPVKRGGSETDTPPGPDTYGGGGGDDEPMVGGEDEEPLVGGDGHGHAETGEEESFSGGNCGGACSLH